MTPEQEARIAEIWGRVQRASQGPWEYGGMIGDPGAPLAHFVKNANGDIVSLSREFAADYAGLDKDQRFIAAARGDIPFLLDALSEATRQVKTCEDGFMATGEALQLKDRTICDLRARLAAAESRAESERQRAEEAEKREEHALAALLKVRVALGEHRDSHSDIVEVATRVRAELAEAKRELAVIRGQV